MASKNPIKVLEKIINVQEQLGEFIANGPDDGLAGYVRDGYRTRCNQAANVPGWLLALSPIAKQTLSNFCQLYYDQQGVDGFISEPPFTGGQCNKRYLVTYTVGTSASCLDPVRVPVTLQVELWGPIRGAFRGPKNCGPDQEDKGPAFIQANSIVGGGNTGSPVDAQVQGSVFDIAIVSVETLDGSPDDCGDPPQPITPGPNPPPDPGPLPGPEPTDDPTGSPFPTLPLPPFPGPFGDFPIEAPADPPAEVDPTTIPPTGGDGLPGQPDAIGNPAGSIQGGGDGEEVDFGAPPTGRVWVGAVITAVVDSRLGNIPGTGPTNTVYPAVIGNVSLKYGDFYGTSKRINSRFTLIGRETTAVILDGCFVQAQPGVTLSVRPISAETCPEPTC